MKKRSTYFQFVVFVVVAFLNSVAPAQIEGTLYGYYYDTPTKTGHLYSLDPLTGATVMQCALANEAYSLSGSSQSAAVEKGLLIYTSQNYPVTPPQQGRVCAQQPKDTDKGYLVTLDPQSCAQTVIEVANETAQANFVKFDNVNSNVYMAFQNPECMHSTLLAVDFPSGKVLQNLGDVVLGATATQMVALDETHQYLYYIPDSYFGFYFTEIRLSTGNMTNVNLDFTKIGGSTQWIYNYNYTFEYVAGKVVGISAFQNKTSPCYPFGVFSVNVIDNKAVLECEYPLPQTQFVNMLSDTAPELGYYFQVLDNSTLVTFDVSNNTIVSQVKCPLCNVFTSISYLPKSSQSKIKISKYDHTPNRI